MLGFLSFAACVLFCYSEMHVGVRPQRHADGAMCGDSSPPCAARFSDTSRSAVTLELAPLSLLGHTHIYIYMVCNYKEHIV